MRPRLVVTAILAGLLVWAAPATARTYYGERIKIGGTWDEVAIVATRIQERDSSKNPRQGQIEGRISAVDREQGDIHLGPFTIAYDDNTGFDGIRVADLEVGKPIEVRVTVTGPGHLYATMVEPGGRDVGANDIEIIGAVTAEDRESSGNVLLEVLGTPVLLQAHIYNAAMLTSRQGERRPADQVTLQLFGRPLVIGGELETRSRHRDNFDLEGIDYKTRVDVGLELEFFYPFSPRYAAFIEIRSESEFEVRVSDGERETEQALIRGESWFYMQDFLLPGIGLQIGRQNFAEKREWWWDANLDAIRLSIGRRPFHAEIAFARELLRESTAEALDPEDEDVNRLLTSLQWDWATDHRLEVFALLHDDRSVTQSIGTVMADRDRDAVDAKLLWLGGRLSGDFDLVRAGTLYYWIDAARLTGEETRLDWQEVDPELVRLDAISTTDVDAWGVDVGLTWQLPQHNPFSLTVGWARGSGDTDANDGSEGSFRQTGLHDNNGKFRGIDRFRYYGEALRPELTNLDIYTLSIGRRIWGSSSIELVYHRYQQVEAADSLRNVTIDVDPNGLSDDIGTEFDFVVGLEEWKHLELEIIAGLFFPGRAFDSSIGESLIVDLKFNYNF